MSRVLLTERQRMTISLCLEAQRWSDEHRDVYAQRVKDALAAGVRPATLANALGVSRQKIAGLAR